MGIAEQFVKDKKLSELPIDPIHIASNLLHIEVVAKDSSKKGVSGMLLRLGDQYAIAYATHIESDGFQRFSVAHEIGHFLLPGHMDQVLPAGTTMHESRSGFVSEDRYELEADHFAAGLLMPDPLFSKAMNKAGEGLRAVESLAALCQTSLTSTALRLVQCSDVPVAMVMSAGGRIEYCFMSGPLKEMRGLDWIRKNVPVPAGTATHRFNQNPKMIAQAARVDATTSIQDWFGGHRNLNMTEEVVGLGNYGKVLTILSLIDDPEEYDEKEDLEESWTPRFRR
ncbi:MAG: ImmA/IrrE family metallo-endopeptidase [Candidatus Tectomicrobia bacterium]|uniref:ImmA/IrrE family metallo-endopeptidase n=1 Tax=Tectimicrobiota bacterium TaxID=2528274 RepID=A0A932MNS3_UNCTE|nr:ImmA/IrrE family metallo-endopeptidase [Candidatus Tectomicrobia bacterium]